MSRVGERYGALVRLVGRLHANGGISHAVMCAKFCHSEDATEVPTAFPCDCGLEEIFRHITVPQPEDL